MYPMRILKNLVESNLTEFFIFLLLSFPFCVKKPNNRTKNYNKILREFLIPVKSIESQESPVKKMFVFLLLLLCILNVSIRVEFLFSFYTINRTRILTRRKKEPIYIHVCMYQMNISLFKQIEIQNV